MQRPFYAIVGGHGNMPTTLSCIKEGHLPSVSLSLSLSLSFQFQSYIILIIVMDEA